MISESVAEAARGPFGFSRTLAPKVRQLLSELPDAQELPAVRGRTVVPAGFEHPVVVGHPNYLGGFETRSAASLISLTGRWSLLQPIPEGVDTVAVAPSDPRHLATSALEEARRLAKQVRQIPGVHLAFKPRSPILVLLLPHAVDGNALPETMNALAGEYPELPGGLRIELTTDVTATEISRYASIIEQVISQEA